MKRSGGTKLLYFQEKNKEKYYKKIDENAAMKIELLQLLQSAYMLTERI